MDDLLKALEKRIKQPVMSGDERSQHAVSGSAHPVSGPAKRPAALPAASDDATGQSGPRSAGLIDIE